MIQVAICDDESLVAHQLESIIWDTCNSAGIKVDTEVYNSGFALEKGILTGQKFDLIYLDIQMKNGDGISTLNWNPSFQFASLSSDLANRLHK